jgi:FkbM family methyltransferase
MIIKKIYNRLVCYLILFLYFILKVVTNIFDFILNLLIVPVETFPNTYRGPRIAAASIEKSLPIISIKYDSSSIIKFFCPGVMPIYRAQTALTKEPETIDWINRFASNSTFWDIGANVGVYSLFAGKKNHKVFAFEPSAPNYFVLNKNIELNSLDKQISALNIALTSKNEIAYLQMGDTTLGAALNSFKTAVREDGESFNVQYSQSSLGFTVDEFISYYQLDTPNYIKIDVDGNEGDILSGMVNTIINPDLKSVLIELASARDDYDDIINFFKANNFTSCKIVDAALDSSSDIRNHIFSRV